MGDHIHNAEMYFRKGMHLLHENAIDGCPWCKLEKVQARVEALEADLKAQENLAQFYKDWIFDAGLPIPGQEGEG